MQEIVSYLPTRCTGWGAQETGSSMCNRATLDDVFTGEGSMDMIIGKSNSDSFHSVSSPSNTVSPKFRPNQSREAYKRGHTAIGLNSLYLSTITSTDPLHSPLSISDDWVDGSCSILYSYFGGTREQRAGNFSWSRSLADCRIDLCHRSSIPVPVQHQQKLCGVRCRVLKTLHDFPRKARKFR